MGQKNKNRTPKIAPGNVPSVERKPRAASVSSQGKTPTWTFNLIDFDGPWCPKGMDQHLLLDVIKKLSAFESMTWSEIEGSKHHSVEVWQIGKQAQNRLIEIDQDDVAELFSLRLSGKERVWGIRDGHIFRLLWWDPDHTVYPVHKKHT